MYKELYIIFPTQESVPVRSIAPQKRETSLNDSLIVLFLTDFLSFVVSISQGIMLSEVLLQTLGLEENQTEKVLSVIERASVDCLRECFNKGWVYTKGEFSIRYQINKSAFRQWTTGYRPSDWKIEAAVKKWLKELHNETFNPTVLQYNFNDFAKLLRDKWVPAACAGTLKALVFIDGDQALKEVSKLDWLLDDPERRNLVHVIVTARKFPRTFPIKEWCTPITCSSNLKDAVDNAIVMQAGMCLYALQELSQTLAYYIVTRDLFAEPLVANLTAFGARAQVINPTELDLGAVLRASNLFPGEESSEEDSRTSDREIEIAEEHLLTSSLSSLSIETAPIVGPAEKYPPVLQNVKKLLLQKQKISLGEVGQKFPLTEKDKGILDCKTWCKVLRLPHVMTFLNARLVETAPNVYVIQAKSPSESTSSSSLDKESFISQLSNEELRQYWKLYWSASLEEFCYKYNINQGNFNSWVNGKRSSSPASSLAVRSWLLSHSPENVWQS